MCRTYLHGNFFRDKKKISMMLKSGKFWSTWVDNVWDENCSHAVNLNYIRVLFDVNEHTFIVWYANNKSNTWKVNYFDDNPPKCECGIFVFSKVRFNIIFSLFYL